MDSFDFRWFRVGWKGSFFSYFVVVWWMEKKKRKNLRWRVVFWRRCRLIFFLSGGCRAQLLVYLPAVIRRAISDFQTCWITSNSFIFSLSRCVCPCHQKRIIFSELFYLFYSLLVRLFLCFKEREREGGGSGKSWLPSKKKKNPNCFFLFSLGNCRIFIVSF